MHRITLLCTAICACAAPAAAQTVYGLVGSDRIVTFSATDPTTITSNGVITGLGTGEVLTGIDIRPADGLIYSVSTSGNVYRLNPSGAGYTATATGSVQTFPPPGAPIPLSGSNFGIDFAPFDRIRLVSDLDQSLRINPLNGGAAVDAPINNGAGAMPFDLIGVAYPDSFPGSLNSMFYGIDGVSSSLVRSLGVPGGVLVNVNLNGDIFDQLGISLNSQSQVGFDILFGNNTNSAYLSANDSFYGVDLATGRATLIGNIGIQGVRGITGVPVPEPATWVMMLLGFAGVGVAMRRHRLRARPA